MPTTLGGRWRRHDSILAHNAPIKIFAQSEAGFGKRYSKDFPN